MAKKNDTLLIVGLGELGGIVLEILARYPNISKIIAADVDAEWGERKTNTALMGATYLNLYPDITFERIDLNNVDETAELLAEIDPYIIYNASTMQSWWVISQLPQVVHDSIYKDFCGLGPWVSQHLFLVYKLMKAVKQAGINPIVINSSFPDNVNIVLDKIDLGVNVGIGNIDLITAPWRKVVSDKLGVPIRSVNVYAIGHHYNSYNLGRTGTGLSAPYYLKILVDDKDVTENFDLKKLASEIPSKAKRTGGTDINWVVAATAVKIILGILFDTKEISHAPGPEGLVGGYPVRLTKNGAKVFLPEDVSLEEAIKINEEAQKWDGIEKTEEDGTVVFTDVAYETFKKHLNYDCKKLKINELEERVFELDKKYKEFARKHGVDV
ncbi:MAG: hypothetical protein ACQEQD_08225 [Bacillota bacterium]